MLYLDLDVAARDLPIYDQWFIVFSGNQEFSVYVEDGWCVECTIKHGTTHGLRYNILYLNLILKDPPQAGNLRVPVQISQGMLSTMLRNLWQVCSRQVVLSRPVIPHHTHPLSETCVLFPLGILLLWAEELLDYEGWKCNCNNSHLSLSIKYHQGCCLLLLLAACSLRIQTSLAPSDN